MRNSFQLPTLFVQSVQSTWTPYCLFKRCGVYANSSLWYPKKRSPLELSLCFRKMRSSHELPLCGVRLNCGLVFKKCGVHFNSPLYFYEICRSLAPPSVFLKNAEFTGTPHCNFHKSGVRLNSPLCFWKMQSSLRSPLQLPFCSKKCWVCIFGYHSKEFV